MSPTQKKTRREFVWEACEQIAERGVKPTLRLVRGHYPHGSPNDVQKDINGWFAKMWADRSAAKYHPTLPSPVADAANALWNLALESAYGELTQRLADAERLAAERLGIITSLNDRVSAYQENEARLLAQINIQSPQPRKSSQKSKETTQ